MTSRRSFIAAMAILASGPTLAPAPTSAATPDESPMGVLRAFYARLDRPYDTSLFSARLARLHAEALRASRQRGRPVMGLDFDPRVAGQDHGPRFTRSLRMNPMLEQSERAIFQVTFDNRGSHDLRYVLVREGGRWLIDEIAKLHGDAWQFSEMLRQGAQGR